jgi:sugar phosphate isomerase/epimerase
MGIVEHSYSIRNQAERGGRSSGGHNDPFRFLQFCLERGASGAQTRLGLVEQSNKIREYLDANDVFLEGSIRLPRNKTQVEVFAKELIAGRDIGVRVFRTALLEGRRYETFSSADAFRRFSEGAYESLLIVKEQVNGTQIRIAVENHKDWRASELATILKRLDCEQIGACVDTGNNIALLEDPIEVVETLAPWAYSTHLKDMAVEECPGGFLLSEVPLGEGLLDLKRIVRILRAAHPEVHFNLEMITRDPLKVPCLEDKYWLTSADLPARELARTLAWVRKNPPKQSLPRVASLTLEEKLKLEDENVKKSLVYARESLGL